MKTKTLSVLVLSVNKKEVFSLTFKVKMTFAAFADITANLKVLLKRFRCLDFPELY